MKAILLGAERGVRRLQAIDSYPLALVEDDQGRKALDWVLAALQSVEIEEITFVGGYHIEKLITQYPHLNFLYNSNWQTTQGLHTLIQARDELTEDCIVSHTNILFHKEAIDPLLTNLGDIVVGVVFDEGFVPFNIDPMHPNAGFSGLVKLSKKGAGLLLKYFDKLSSQDEEEYLKSAGLGEFLSKMHQSGIKIDTVNISNSLASVDANLSMAQFIFGSKAQTLERLQHQVKNAEILDQLRFSVGEWRNEKKSTLKSIKEKFGAQPVVVRSSSHNEDSWQESHAGKYHSALDIDTQDEVILSAAIEKVIQSFGKETKEDQDHFFVQRFLSQVKVSGVLFTRDIETKAPYLVVNYDAISGRSDTVTGGDGHSLATSYAFRGHEDRIDEMVRPLANVVKEIQEIVDHDSLDIEFAIDEKDQCYILQVRPLTPKPGFTDQLDERDISAEIESAQSFLQNALQKHPLLLGSTTVFSNMSDWNPAEIIGTTPRPLAASLYRHLITDDVWSQSRTAMGGRDTHSIPLMYIIGGHPFIDVRASVNSFIPASVGDELARKLVDHAIDQLSSKPKLHDKLEFDIALTCLDFAFEERADELQQYGFDGQEIRVIREAFKKQTADIISLRVQPFSDSKEALEQLAKRRETILANSPQHPNALCQAIGLLLDDCKKLGTFTFANLARQGFVATLLLRSLHHIGAINDDFLARIQVSMPTVAGDLTQKLSQLVDGDIGQADFLREFGHLRPGTYDILSPSYSEQPDLYLSDLSPIGSETSHANDKDEFESLMAQLPLDKLCKDYDMGFTGQELSNFIHQAIPGREWGKFEFSKSLNAALSLIKQLGETLDFSLDDMSMLPIWKLLNARTESSPSSWQNDLKREIEWNRKAFKIAKTLRLPGVIRADDDILGFTETEDWPNFITGKTITAPISYLKGRDIKQSAYKGRIIAIEHSDPGYDWLFGHNIAGLITKYGGVASHMAIRCAEFGLPAAIGCGERIFESASKANVVELNCANRRISLVK